MPQPVVAVYFFSLGKIFLFFFQISCIMITSETMRCGIYPERKRNIMSWTKIFKKNNREEQPTLTREQKLFREFRDYLYIFAIFMVLCILLFRVVVVDGSSMNQTLVDGDRMILVSGIFYRNPQQGDVIVASKDSFRDGECIVKRVIATEGQTVDIDFANRIVYVDGVALEESYVYFADGDTGPMIQEGVTFPLVVQEGCVFVMGDNRNDSKDSRSPQIGLIDCREILGKAIFLLWPGDGNYSRIGGIN